MCQISGVERYVDAHQELLDELGKGLLGAVVVKAEGGSDENSLQVGVWLTLRLVDGREDVVFNSYAEVDGERVDDDGCIDDCLFEGDDGDPCSAG